jgi:glycosyltransferase involved in cell wall biosynthesis
LKRLLFVINADWYFSLHWIERAINAAENGYDVTIALPQCSSEIRELIESNGMRLHTFPMDRTSLGPLGEIRSLIKLKSIIKNISPDLIHSITIKPNLYCSILCSMLSIPLVCTYPGLGTLKVSNKVVHRLSRFFVFRIISFFSKKMKYKSLFENDQDIAFFRKNKFLQNNNLIRVFGAGVDVSKFKCSVKKHDNGPFKILFASRLLKNKGLEILVESCQILNNLDGMNVELVVAGITDSHSSFSLSPEEISKISSHKFVHWLGHRNDIPDLISVSDLVALPTEYGEGIPRILIEASAMGRPIVTTSSGGCRDICLNGITGYVINPKDKDALKAVIEKLYLSPIRRNEMGKMARKLVESKFSNEFIFKQNLEVYDSLLNSVD